MKKIVLNNKDLHVAPIGLGTVNAGLVWNGPDADNLFDLFMDLGGNLIDTAHVYSDWIKPERARSERVIGEWFARSKKRDKIVLVTKGGHPDITATMPNMHNSRMKKEDMQIDLDGSLNRLQTDYIDIYLYHRDDTNQPVEALIDVMEEFVQQGKIRYYGCSNWSTDRILAADRYCKETRKCGFVTNQMLFNLGLHHMKPLLDDTMISMDEKMYQYHKENPFNLAMPYMGACNGFFHRYLEKGDETVSKSPYYTPGNIVVAKQVKKLMDKYEASATQIVLGFFFAQEFQCLPLIGVSSQSQLIDAMKTMDIPFIAKDFVFA